MYDLRRGLVAVLALCAFAVVPWAAGRTTPKRVVVSPAALLTPAARTAGLTFAPEVSAGDRQVVLAAIARARPEARRLIEAVDGLVTIRVGGVNASAVGLTHTVGNRFEVVLDLGQVWHQSGDRGVARLVLHELGHVVDFVLVPSALKAKLDAGIPSGYGCDPGVADGACTAPAERFAETFAKWATGDLGFDVNLGYKVLAPASLDTWAQPLTTLAPR
jgi:hypothetical protein